MALVAYGASDSDNSDVEEEQTVKQTLGDDFFDDVSTKTEADHSVLKADDNLEEIVKPKQWEIELAEKRRRKLEKKAKKAAKKEKKKEKAEKEKDGAGKKKEKRKIAAFGSLFGKTTEVESSDDEEDSKKPAQKLVEKRIGGGFLSMLPAPKGKNNVSDMSMIKNTSFVPKSAAKVEPAKPVVTQPAEELSSDDEDFDASQIFGNLTRKRVHEDDDLQSEIPQIPINSTMEMAGPSRPSEDDYVHPSQMYNMVDDDEDELEGPTSSNPKRKNGTLSDEQVHKLIMRNSFDIGNDSRTFSEMASSVVDVSVDAAIGPDVKSTIMKNLGKKYVKAASNLPDAPAAGQLARRKHQITYLANLAVSREEALQEKWAESKNTKRHGRQKYGF